MIQSRQRSFLMLLLAVLFLPFSELVGQDNVIVFEKYKLANGLQIVLHKDASIPIVAIGMMYHVGSKDENPSQTGFAHFFEHLLMEGSKHTLPDGFLKLVTAAGGTSNANTTADRTFFYQVLPSNYLELGIYLEAERIQFVEINSKVLEKQKETVAREYQQRIVNQHYMTFRKEISKRAFSVHPYQWTPYGDPSHVATAKKSDFQSFYEKFYIPNNATLTIAGDFDPETCKAWIQKYFGSIPRKAEVKRSFPNEPSLGTQIRDVVFDDIKLDGVFQAFRIPDQTSPDFYALKVLDKILTKGRSSRMQKNMIDRQETAIQVSSFAFANEDPSLMVILAIGNLGVGAESLERALDSEIFKLQRFQVSQEELAKAQNQLEAEFLDQNSSMLGIAEQLAYYSMFYGNPDALNQELDKFYAITALDIKRVAQTYFQKNNSVVLHYLPVPKTEDKD